MPNNDAYGNNPDSLLNRIKMALLVAFKTLAFDIKVNFSFSRDRFANKVKR